MAFYEDMRDDVAVPLITEFGQPLILYRTEDTVTYTRNYDPVTMSYYWEDGEGTRFDTEPTETQVEYSGYCITSTFSAEQIDGTNIKSDDLLLMSIGIPRPQLGDILRVDGVDYQYVRNNPVSPGGVDILQKTQVRA